MKTLLIIVILAAAAAAAEIGDNVPVGDQELMAPEGAEITFDDDVDDEVEANDFPLPRAQTNLILGSWNNAHRLLMRDTRTRPATSGVTHDDRETFNFSSSYRIGLIQVREVGGTQGALVSVVRGGINRSGVVLRFQSQRGRGYNYLVEMWRNNS